MSPESGGQLTPAYRKNKGIVLAFTGAVLMSLDPIFVKLAGVSSVDAAFLFGLFAAISMNVTLKSTQKQWLYRAALNNGWPVFASGLLMLFSASSLMFSFTLTSVANTFVIMATGPVVTALFGRLFLGERLKPTTWIAALIIGMGVWITTSDSQQAGHFLGDLFAFSAVIFLSLNQTLLRKYKQVSRLTSIGLGASFIAVTMLAFASPSTYSPGIWALMAIMGLLTAPFGRVCSQAASRYIRASDVSVILMLEVILAPVFAFFVLNEIPGQSTLIGGALILFTLLVFTLMTTSSFKEKLSYESSH